ncbi:hypothetical protein SAMN05421788_103318 [Filimonas lacunae]|uniref:2OG-Fe(II) oxygenase superfamily protein n=1 Tax=Filimonas lacunae TaxID=477680 RepID=A0A173MK04_9BACT|nr:hypothetical protein [Filimonas lacunae]BAV07975.1 hypothetical protein FLA_4007 [Filimonas lacunae]SIT07335.1 hypothetical protein SAMN05421788_103318 [Filimonas lacunae]
MNTSVIENKISTHKNVLVVLQEDNTPPDAENRYLMDHFCGKVVHSFAEIQPTQERVYVCGNINATQETPGAFFIIKELSTNYESYPNNNTRLITLGEVPVVISNAGVYFRKLFTGNDYFHKIKSEHNFQELTESNKQSKAFRKGIYLTNITKEEKEDGKEALHYRLLRCSSNLTGPTDNFRTTDREIIHLLNDAAKYVFEYPTDLNHVLAQIYENKKRTDGSEKEDKARIKAHSDKTKDMPQEGLIAFCTFYENADASHLKPSATDRYDVCFKDVSGLTKLHFKLKSTVEDASLEKEFSVTLYPDSAFIIPLSTNRLYTHEIRPSMLNADRMPTRLGYVVRCSNVEARYIDDQAYLFENGQLIQLEPITTETHQELKGVYYKENISEKIVQYGKVHFSMNTGDYEKPIY